MELLDRPARLKKQNISHFSLPFGYLLVHDITQQSLALPVPDDLEGGATNKDPGPKNGLTLFPG
jgi:hypothetical protein